MSAEAERAGSRTTRRSASRLAAVQALYQIEITGAPARQVIAEFRAHRLGREIEGATYLKADEAFFSDVVEGALTRGAEIDAAIAGALVDGWTLERLDSPLRAALRAGTYELMARPDVPARVIVSEYVDVAHAFFGGAEPGFLNGVLHRLGQGLRPGELRGDDGREGPQAG